MPRSRGSEMPQQQRQSPRAALHLKSASSDSNGVHARGSPKPEDTHRRSPRSPLVESPGRNQRKSLSRVSELETKLEHAQEELRKLRERLASAEAANKDAQRELEAAKKTAPVTAAAGRRRPGDSESGASRCTVAPIKHPVAAAAEEEHRGSEEEHRGSVATQKWEDDPDAEIPELVPVCADYFDVDSDGNVGLRRDGIGPAMEVEEGKEKTEMSELLEAKLAEKEEELERRRAENSALRRQLAEAEAEAGAARAREEEAASKLGQAAEELARSKAAEDRLREEVEATEGTRASLEAETKKLRVQTEQWRKAADAAAAVLSGPEAAAGRRVAERCPSMEKHLFDGPGSPLVEEGGGLGGGRRKGAGIRALGDLWKKKAQYK